MLLCSIFLLFLAMTSPPLPRIHDVPLTEFLSYLAFQISVDRQIVLELAGTADLRHNITH